MTRLVLEQVTDFGDFTRGTELSEFLKPSQSNGCWTNSLSDVRVSPDGRHIHIILRRPKVGLMTYDKYQRPQLIQSQKHLDLGLPRTSPIVDVVYLNYSRKRDGGVAVLAVVFENGKAEFWKFLECKGGWHLLQTSDLCNSPRAKVVSVSACSNFIVWCEERPPSESSSTCNTTRSNFRYCICKRSYEVDEGAVSLGGVKIALHNNPCYQLVSTVDNVYLLPDCTEKCVAPSISKFFLAWFPQHDTFRVSTTCKGTLLRKDCPLTKESDFKRLITDCVGYLSSLNPPEIYGFSPTGCGGLLLLLSTGKICLLQRDGVMREVYKLADNCLAGRDTHNSLHIYQDTLALTVGRTLYLIDTKSGRELEKISLRREGLLYVNQGDKQAPQLLSESGLFVVMLRESDPPRGPAADPRPSSLDATESLRPGALLVEAVFEEACRYYQQRSLGSTQLTVEKLKKGGMFQAPISLASILREYLHGGTGGGSQEAAAAPWGTGGGGGGGQDKLRVSLDAELKALVSLEEVKRSVVRGSGEEVQVLLESLVQQEVSRLLSSQELDRDALLYLNSIFSLFPRQAWKATYSALQLRCNGEGSLSCRAPPEVWKTLLTPLQHPSTPANLPCANGKPKHTPGLKPSLSHSNLKPSPSSSPPAANLTLAVFELLCRSVFLFQPSWLPRFLELAQQQQGSAGLGLALSSSPWSYSAAGRGAESGECVPLYKRALSVLPGSEKDQDLEVDLLLVSGRPNAVLQALRILMGRSQWERVTQVAQKFCRQSPLLNKEIFSILLCEVAQHRDLDPYLDLLWTLCPEDVTVTSILNMVLKNIPTSSTSTPFSSSSTATSAVSSSSPSASPCPAPSSQVTVGLLKPLLSKVLQRETKPSQRYADILQSPSFPPPTPPRQENRPPRAATMPALPDQSQPQEPHDDLYSNMCAPLLDLQSDPPTHMSVVGRRMTSPPNPV